jgi:hypothetical protein
MILLRSFSVAALFRFEVTTASNTSPRIVKLSERRAKEGDFSER